MLQGRFLASVVAPAGVVAVPVLVIMAGYAMVDTTGTAIEWVNGVTILAVLMLMLLLYSMLAAIQMAAPPTDVRHLHARLKWAAAAVGVVAAMLVTITWLVWANGAGWPLGDPATYVVWLASVAALWLLLVPGALLQAGTLDAQQRPMATQEKAPLR